MSLEVLLPVVVASISVIGWFVTYSLSKKREDQTRRLEKTIRHLERQIEEFYGPLFNLVHQIVIANHVQQRILSGSSKGKLSDEQYLRVRRFFQERFFFPIHAEITQILKNRLHLVEGANMPPEFYQYLKHSIQEQSQSMLWNNQQIDTSFVQGEPYPNELYQVLKESLTRLMAEYAKYSRALEPGVKELPTEPK